MGLRSTLGAFLQGPVATCGNDDKGDNADNGDKDDDDDNDDNGDNRIPRAYAVEMALPLPTLSDTVPPQTERPSGGQ